MLNNDLHVWDILSCVKLHNNFVGGPRLLSVRTEADVCALLESRVKEDLTFLHPTFICYFGHTIGFTLQYFKTCQQRPRGSKTHLFPKQIVRRKNKLNSFGNLTGYSSHVPVFPTTSKHFEFVPRKNKSCVWRRSRDMVTYIIYAFESSLSLSFSHVRLSA